MLINLKALSVVILVSQSFHKVEAFAIHNRWNLDHSTIHWSDSTDTDCSNFGKPNGDYLSGTLSDIKQSQVNFTNEMWNLKTSQGLLDLKESGSCYNADWRKLAGKDNLNQTNPVLSHFLIQFESEREFNTILFFARSDCDGRTEDIVSYTRLEAGLQSSKNCFVQRSSDYTFKSSSSSLTPDIQSFWLMRLPEADSRMCKGSTIENGCMFPVMKNPPHAGSTLDALPQDITDVSPLHFKKRNDADSVQAAHSLGAMLKSALKNFPKGATTYSGLMTTTTGSASVSTSQGPRVFTTISQPNGQAIVAQETDVVITYRPIIAYSQQVVDNGAGLTVTQTVQTSSSVVAVGTATPTVTTSTLLVLPGSMSDSNTMVPKTVMVTETVTRKHRTAA